MDTSSSTLVEADNTGKLLLWSYSAVWEEAVEVHSKDKKVRNHRFEDILEVRRSQVRRQDSTDISHLDSVAWTPS